MRPDMLAREVVLTGSDFVFLIFVLMPFGCGLLTGLLLPRRIPWFAGAAVWCAVIVAFPPLIPEPLTQTWGSGRVPGSATAMAMAWLMLGLAAGRLATMHRSLLGWDATVLILAFGVSAACLFSLAVNLPLMAVQGASRHDIGQAAIVWSGYLVVLPSVALRFGPAALRRIWPRLRRAVLGLFTAMGLVTALIQLGTGELIEGFLWWVPVQPPVGYKILQPLAFGPLLFLWLRGALPQADASGLSDADRNQVARRLVGLATPADRPRADALGARFCLPARWRRKRPKAEMLAVWSMAPEPWHRSWTSRSWLTVQALRWPGEPPADADQMRFETKNLIVWRASFIGDDIGTRHGVRSHEVRLQAADGNFIYLVWFVLNGIAFVYLWQSADVYWWETHLSDVDCFIDTTWFHHRQEPTSGERS